MSAYDSEFVESTPQPLDAFVYATPAAVPATTTTPTDTTTTSP